MYTLLRKMYRRVNAYNAIEDKRFIYKSNEVEEIRLRRKKNIKNFSKNLE